jgi:hypothetical protein
MAGACSSLLLFLLFLARASAATQAAMPYAADYEEAPAKQPLDDDPNGYYEDGALFQVRPLSAASPTTPRAHSDNNAKTKTKTQTTQPPL